MDEDLTQKQVANVCPHCEHKNPPGALICEACNRMLQGGKAGTTRHIDENTITGETLAGEPNVHLNDRKLDFPPQSTFAIQMREVDDPIVYQPADAGLLIGRRNEQSDFVPDIDLYPYAGYLLGVSRRHARIYQQNNRLMIEDLGSSNGTFINGERIAPNNPVPLYDGAEVSLGKLHFTVRF